MIDHLSRCARSATRNRTYLTPLATTIGNSAIYGSNMDVEIMVEYYLAVVRRSMYQCCVLISIAWTNAAQLSPPLQRCSLYLSDDVYLCISDAI